MWFGYMIRSKKIWYSGFNVNMDKANVLQLRSVIDGILVTQWFE